MVSPQSYNSTFIHEYIPDCLKNSRKIVIILLLFQIGPRIILPIYAFKEIELLSETQFIFGGEVVNAADICKIISSTTPKNRPNSWQEKKNENKLLTHKKKKMASYKPHTIPAAIFEQEIGLENMFKG